MARRNRPQRPAARPLAGGTVRRSETHADGEWIVSTAPAKADSRTYVCPVCCGRLPSTTAHVVVWPVTGGVDERRHVHTTCWRRRAAQHDPVRW